MLEGYQACFTNCSEMAHGLSVEDHYLIPNVHIYQAKSKLMLRTKQ